MFSRKLICCKIAVLSMLCAKAYAWQPDVQECKDQTADQLTEMFSCASLSGTLRLYSFTNNDAYMIHDKDEDSTAIGGMATYKTANYQGLNLALGVVGQYDISRAEHPLSTLNGDRFGLGEAYISWRNQDFAITAGNQKLDLPFLGEWSIFRVLPWLYRGVDFQYGDKDDFFRATRVTHYKSYVTDEFTQTSRLADDASYSGDTKGLLAVGVGKKFNFANRDWLKTQFWYEKYYDITDIYYLEMQYKQPDWYWQPAFSVQGIYSEDSGAARLGKIESQTFGAQLVLQPKENTSWQIGYNKILENQDVYKNGALVTPYAHMVTSTPIYAQSFLSSTQDFGAGQAFSSQLVTKINQNLSLGGRYAFIKMRSNPDAKFNHMSEYLLFGTYRFSGKLKGFSVSDYFALQSKPSAEHDYFHNRLMLNYDF
ncbi:hypothetical protein [Acinetobacter guillouiae]|uniref:hypothetical protein n=1 Tax=Acinetobacter guillouiae TaxID=106649 RepID=UPI002FDA28BB